MNESELELVSEPVYLREKTFLDRLYHNKRGMVSLSAIGISFATFFVSLLLIFTLYFFFVIIMGSLGNLVIWMFSGFSGAYPQFSPENAVDIITKVFSIMGPAINWTLYIAEWCFYWLFKLLRIDVPAPVSP